MMTFENGYGIVDSAFEDKGWLEQASLALDRKELTPSFGDLMQEMTDPLFAKIISTVSKVPKLVSSKETTSVVTVSPGSQIKARSIQVSAKGAAFQRITAVLFLNEAYKSAWGGHFVLEGPYGRFMVEPIWNRFLIYESDDRIFSGVDLWAPEGNTTWKAVTVNYFSNEPPPGRDVTTKAILMTGGGRYSVV